MGTPRTWDFADADPVGAATGWLAGPGRFTDLLTALATGPGRQVGATSGPPFPRLRIADTNDDPRDLRGLTSTSLSIEVLGDPDGRPGKAQLRRVAVAALETLHAMTAQPAVGGCVFTQVTGGGLAWSPLPPANQPRYVLSVTLWWRPVW